jgi:GlpG protein
MRMIGYLESEPLARTFSDYLYVRGIKNQLEAEADGTWGVWIHAEDEIDQARSLLQSYVANPTDGAVLSAAEKARDLAAEEQKIEEAVRKQHFDSDRIFRSARIGGLTLALIVISVVVYLIQMSSRATWLIDYLYISDPYTFSKDLPEVRQGQLWRLLTPVFLHFGMLHILFNMLWLRDLGAMIEERLGTSRLLLLVVVIGVASNVAQYLQHGANFGGMSGVVYGLLGYVWMRGRFSPDSGLSLHPSTVTMMLVWLAFGYTNILPMANTVHTVGLVTGVVWGFAAAKIQASL